VLRVTLAAAPLALGLTAQLRPDPLLPVPEVEGIFVLLRHSSPAAAALALAALLTVCLSPLAARARSSAVALSVYLLVAAAWAAAHPFPVPLVGMGMSPILGCWLGAGMLCATARE
jgi:hypothetical protein